MRVVPADLLEPIGLLEEIAHRVAAEQGKPVSARQTVPEQLELNGRFLAAFLPQDVDHFAIGADERAIRTAREKAADDPADARLKPGGIRFVVHHEQGQCLVRIEDHQFTKRPGLFHINHPAAQMLENRCGVRGCGDDDGRVSSTRPWLRNPATVVNRLLSFS